MTTKPRADISRPSFDKPTVQHLLRSGLTVAHGDHIRAAALFWLVREAIPAGEVVRFECRETGAVRYGLAGINE